MVLLYLLSLLLPILMLSGSPVQADGKRGGKDAVEKSGNFMEDEQWLATISQYSRKIKHWNRFRDVSLFERPKTGFLSFICVCFFGCFFFFAHLMYEHLKSTKAPIYTKRCCLASSSSLRLCPEPHSSLQH